MAVVVVRFISHGTELAGLGKCFTFHIGVNGEGGGAIWVSLSASEAVFAKGKSKKMIGNMNVL